MEEKGHRLVLEEREKLSVTGVEDVERFDENAVVLHTTLGTLVIQGQGLQLKKLSEDGVCVEGSIGALEYQQQSPAGSWVHRLFG